MKLLDAGPIYPIYESSWVSQVHVVPKKGGTTIIINWKNELIPTRTVTGWRVCLDYRRLNIATRKDHFPLPFIDQILERLAGHDYYCFLDGYSGIIKLQLLRKTKKRHHSHARMVYLHTEECHSGCVMLHPPSNGA